MKNDIRYRMDYGQYNAAAESDNFCIANCRFFSDCPGKGGFCSFIERRELLPEQEALSNSLLQESGEGGKYARMVSATPALTSFWSFPTGRGAVQPWRRKLWELKNKL
ncbi:hypothetical protein H1230_05455 [Paenibacillus sp. 19GGS1-52]|uniref:hypothetical protein n=1 Tax=Paenibacillus sp. 19GGS1-52 TaxID=2758563 RepID=UPI001EFB401D|nr:hypothetical protein [Paenibacillus sp. 19GGS1-52]ULO08281.1 hypothetical protein H1230_05455 [Paenibacillus sp. 19GGS1-52]